jgi:hypothetical protein
LGTPASKVSCSLNTIMKGICSSKSCSAKQETCEERKDTLVHVENFRKVDDRCLSLRGASSWIMDHGCG